MDDPILDEEFKRLKKRDLFQTYLFKMSCAFGPPKCRNRVIVAPPMSKFNVSVNTYSRGKPLPVLPTTTVLENKSAAARRFKRYPGGNSVKHADWISDRRAFREELDRLGDLDKWFYNKPDLTEIEILVMDRRKQSQKMLPLPSVLSHMTKMQARCVSQREKAEVNPRATEFSQRLETQETPGSRARACSDDTVLEEPEDQDQGQQQGRKGNMQKEEILTSPVQMDKKTKDAHSYPSSLGGPTGDIIDDFRRQSLKEYLGSLEQSHRQGLAVSRATLQRALLYPGDVSVCKDLVTQQAGSGAHPGLYDGRRGWVTYFSPPRRGKEETTEQGAAAARKGYRELTTRQHLIRREDPCTVWPNHDGNAWVYQPVTSRRPAGVLFHCIEHTQGPSPGHWPVNQAGYFTSGDITGHRVYTL